MLVPLFNHGAEPFDVPRRALLSDPVKAGDRPCMHFGGFRGEKKNKPQVERGWEARGRREGGRRAGRRRRNVLRDGNAGGGGKLCRCGTADGELLKNRIQPECWPLKG